MDTLVRHNKNVGLNGWFSRILTFVGGLIGGPVGASAGIALGTYLEEKWPDIFQWGDKTFTTVDPKEQLVRKWTEKTLVPWSEPIFKTLKGSSNQNTLKSEDYRNKINNAIKAFEKLRVYLQVERRNLSSKTIIDNIDIEGIKNKEDVVIAFKKSIIDGYVESLKKIGVTAKTKSITFNAKSHNSSGPEPYNWGNKTFTSTLNVFVDPNDQTAGVFVPEPTVPMVDPVKPSNPTTQTPPKPTTATPTTATPTQPTTTTTTTPKPTWVKPLLTGLAVFGLIKIIKN